MNKVVLVAVVALVATTTAGASRGGPDLDQARKTPSNRPAVATKRSGCPYAHLGVRYYRNTFVRWQLQRGASIPTWRKPRNCADARYLAVVWAKRSYASRMETKEHHARIAREKARQRRLENQHPKWIALRLLGGDRSQWQCLINITWWENRTMDPTLDFGGGHGNVNEAYGIPQAKPGYKMASAGPDWRTNPETQLRWMIGYARARYGSLCNAWYHRDTQGWY